MEENKPEPLSLNRMGTHDQILYLLSLAVRACGGRIVIPSEIAQDLYYGPDLQLHRDPETGDLAIELRNSEKKEISDD